MKKKIFVILFTLVLTSTVLNIPKGINVIATSNYGDPDIDHEYILNRTYNLSQIVFYPDCVDWGRYFGTKGEQEAAENIEYWMENLSLDCVKKEPINSTWKTNEGVNTKLNEARAMKIFYLNITVRNAINGNLIEYKNLSNTQCFPYFQHQWREGEEYDSLCDKTYNEILVVEKFSLVPLPQMELCETHYSKSYKIFNQLENFPEKPKWIRQLMGSMPWY